MISLEEARRIITENVEPIRVVSVTHEDAVGRVLREDIVADAAYPSSDRSLMDGYAIISDDPAERFKVTMEIHAGQMPRRALQPGECARIFTGAPLPLGATRVIPQEEARREGDVMIPQRRDGKTCVRLRGAEAQPGDVLLRAGTRIGAPEMAILAQIGKMEVLASMVPLVIHVATGDELVDPSATPGEGEIRDSNSSLLHTLGRSDEAIVDSARCCDDLPALVATCEEGIASHPHSPDMLLLSGGASVGEHDFGAKALRQMGFTIHFDRVNLRPGKPLTFASRDGMPAFVIPGNPVSHFVCYHVAIRLAMDRLHGIAPAWDFGNLPLGGEETLRGDLRETFWPARVVVRDGVFVVLPKRWTSSGDTFSLAGSNALIRVLSDAKPGELVPVLLLESPR